MHFVITLWLIKPGSSLALLIYAGCCFQLGAVQDRYAKKYKSNNALEKSPMLALVSFNCLGMEPILSFSYLDYFLLYQEELLGKFSMSTPMRIKYNHACQ